MEGGRSSGCSVANKIHVCYLDPKGVIISDSHLLRDESEIGNVTQDCCSCIFVTKIFIAIIHRIMNILK